MTNKQIVIDDQKKTIHRLQDECTEKTNAIIALGEQLKRKEQECEELKKINKANAKSYEKHWYKLEKYKQTLTEIKEFVENEMTQNGDTNIILQKISNANTY